MPRDKDLKRLVRTRMKKTGESYTTARARVVSKPRRSREAAPAAAAAADPDAPPAIDAGARGEGAAITKSKATPKTVVPEKDYAGVAGMSDETIRAKTGHVWKEWLRIVDDAGGREMNHTQRAAMISEVHGVDGWWSQCVTTGYERITGLRARSQRMDGTWEANKSKTYAVPVPELFEAWSDGRFRRRWLSDPTVKVRTASAPKSMRLQFPDGTIAAIGFWPKGERKSSVSVQHTKLSGQESVERMKRYWKERLDALSALLDA
jgi:hypothetical protein